MKKCMKTMSGKHIWTVAKTVEEASIIGRYLNIPYTDVRVCLACDLIDDRPPRKEKNKV